MGPAPMNRLRWPLELALLACLLMVGGGVAAAPDATRSIDGQVEQFGHWALGCSNLRVCTAVARLWGNDAADQPVHIEITFTADKAEPHTVSIERDGTEIERLSPSAAQQVFKDLLEGEGVDAIYIDRKGMRFDVPRKGFKQVSRTLAEWRSRPPQQLLSTEVITPLPAVRINKPVVPPSFRGIAKRCPKGHMGSAIQAWRLVGGATLWRADCGNEGLNSVNFWAISGLQGAPSELIQFADQDGVAQPFNSWFDARTGYLRMTHYYGHWQSFADDCGVYRAYALSRGGMKLVEKRSMPICGTGIGPHGWVTTYHATVLNGPDSGP